MNQPADSDLQISVICFAALETTVLMYLKIAFEELARASGVCVCGVGCAQDATTVGDCIDLH